MALSVTILGCGSSGGVPRVGSGWGACDPAEPRNRRRRCSILITQDDGRGQTRVLVDTSPDCREQLIDAGVTHLDAVVITHAHADHIHGIDDLRPLVIHMRRRIPIYMDDAAAKRIMAGFDYIFEAPPGSDYPPIATRHRIVPGETFLIEGAGGSIALLPFGVPHGSLTVMGLRFGDIAYTPDLHAVPDSARRHLIGLDLWIIDALRHTPHPTHLSLSQALAEISAVKPARAVLTNLHTDLDYRTLRATLPPGIEPAHDGMILV